MIKCIIVDDEPLAQQVLENHVRQTVELELVKKCANALEAFDVISNEVIDLIFLDIQMPFLDGTRFIKTLKNPPRVIFTTAFSSYAAESYELDAVDYLLKPITYDRFSKSMARFFKLHAPAEPVTLYSYFKVNGRLVKVMHAEIIYARCIKDYMFIKTTHEKYITHMTMKYLVELLPKETFSQVHRSYLVNRLHIKTISKNAIEMETAHIPVGKNYRLAIAQLKSR